MLNGWFFLALLFAGVDWLALWFKKTRINYFSKPAVLLCLILWFTSLGGWQAAPNWFGLALVFSLAGDVLLLLPERFFVWGLLAFLVAQVGYVAGFFPRLPVDALPLFVIGIPIFLIGGFLYKNLCRHIQPHPVHRRLVDLILVYCIAINMMLFFTLLTLAEPDWSASASALVAAGGVLFYASDAVLSSNRFIHPIPKGKLLVRILYHLGQVGLTAGVMLQYLRG